MEGTDALRIDLQITMETLYTGAIHGFPHTGGIAGGISNGIAGTLDRDGALSLIVVLGGSLSLVALVFAFITYSLFSDLRSLAGTTLMNLLAALFMVQLLFIVGVGGVQDSELCISLGLSLQYVRVSVVCWLAAMCHHLYATVASLPCCDDAPAYLKYSIFAWGAPMISFGLAILLQRQENHDFWDIHDLTPFNCWFLGSKATVYTYGIPVVLLLLVSGYYLLKAAIVARYTCSMQLEVKRREKMKRRRALQLVLFLKVNLIIGSVAGCGVAARVWEIPILWAIFCTGHSLQGLAVALSVACNCRVLKVYARKAHKQPKHQIAKSSSMQLLAPPPDPV
ncbi:cadherin EGF LAG seven-pass G-type receptor 1 isoform X2 [Cephus cinctus]|uniref:Cadherin EGF LAG seven-pass G-type receptor 1 isoform X2 n=1 Tax=Cephus cinctus TaxID=211228 RepID=A0AAJ7BIQ0_CEPCN|nr:cadherin EGF LAG seven-pass G-type receptor 1 isoform X2 [Cephus cinctus]